MYCGSGRLCVCLCASVCFPSLHSYTTARPGCNFGSVVGGCVFAIGARVSLLRQHTRLMRNVSEDGCTRCMVGVQNCGLPDDFSSVLQFYIRQCKRALCRKSRFVIAGLEWSAVTCIGTTGACVVPSNQVILEPLLALHVVELSPNANCIQ